MQAAMVLERVREPEFYRLVTGEEFPGEYGERVSARRRGRKFEANLEMNNAALLRRAIAPLYRYDPEEMEVRNFAEEVPGPVARGGGLESMRGARLARTRNVLKNLASGARAPHLLIQPQLRLQTGQGPKDYAYVTPDFAVLDPASGIYVPGEMKSFIVRNGTPDRADLELTRRQAAAEIIALRAEGSRFGMGERVSNRAIFIFALPSGFKPAAPVVEVLDAEVREVRRAMDTLAAVRVKLGALRTGGRERLENMIHDLLPNFQESCIGSCILASPCKEVIAGGARRLGDRAAGLFGEMNITRVVELALDGAEPRDARERELAADLRVAADALGYRQSA
jgi:hypothetical protein